jgi:hypothetical protein
MFQESATTTEFSGVIFLSAGESCPGGREMNEDPHSRLAERTIARAEERRKARRAAFLHSSSRETIASLMLGTIAATLGLVVVIAAIAGIANVHQSDWHVRASVTREVRPRRAEQLYDAEQNRTISVIVRTPVTTIILPSGWSFALGCTGLLLCVPGFSRRRVSPLCLLTAIAILLALGIPWLCLIMGQLFYWLLDACT